MGKLKVLPAGIANMIAAGEVVQRPASVVKELMENAVDAGATQVTVVVSDAGRTLIQVIDNGSGMSPEDAVLCFERHATSKIATKEDLEAIGTFGFRGEALASIAAVAEVTLRTRRGDDETATQVTIADQTVASVDQVSGPIGSNFAIRNLFYNTPARRKFLKSDNVELKHVIEEFTHVALTRPEVGFSLNSNGKDLFVLKKAKSLKFRVMDLLGNGVAADIVDISAETSILRMNGFIGRPDTAKKTLGNQFMFVNGRYFRSPYFHKAIMKAYEEMMPEGLTPSYILYLEVDPHSIDVNIHPTKTEIKFEEDSVIFQILYASVRETLGKNSFGASIDFDTEGAVQMPQISRSFEEYRGTAVTPNIDFDPNYNPFEMSPVKEAPSFPAPSYKTPEMPGGGYSQYVEKRDDYGKLFEEKTLPSTQTMVLQGKYILTQTASGMMAVNIRRAQERIQYEKMLSVLSEGGHVSQMSMFPVQVQVGAAQRLLFDEHQELLSSMGFDISAFGTDTVVVNGVPEGYSCEEGKVIQMVGDLLLILSEDFNALPEVMRSRMAERFAMLSAANMSPVSTAFEAQRLIDTLFACENPEFTSGGRRVVTVIPIEELDKKF